MLKEKQYRNTETLIGHHGYTTKLKLLITFWLQPKNLEKESSTRCDAKKKKTAIVLPFITSVTCTSKSLSFQSAYQISTAGCADI